MLTSEAQLRATRKYRAKNVEAERIDKRAYYYANKETMRRQQKEYYQRKKAERAELDQRKTVAEILLRHRQTIHEELLDTYRTQGMPEWIVDAICVDMSQLFGLVDPRMLGKNPRLTAEDPVIVSPSPIPDN
jgi:asparagine synthetase B (glutamine-hydrolysing)